MTSFSVLTKALAWVAAFLFVLAGFMLTYEVTARYLFVAPTIWAMELSQLCLIWGSMIAMPWLLGARRHIAVDAMTDLLRPGLKRTCEGLAMAFVAGISAVIAWMLILGALVRPAARPRACGVRARRPRPCDAAAGRVLAADGAAGDPVLLWTASSCWPCRLFLLMSNILLKGGVGRDLFAAVHAWVGHWPGGLAVATILSCGIFAAISGSSVATAATIGTVAIPEMISPRLRAPLRLRPAGRGRHARHPHPALHPDDRLWFCHRGIGDRPVPGRHRSRA
jgi:hypothetical protein